MGPTDRSNDDGTPSKIRMMSPTLAESELSTADTPSGFDTRRLPGNCRRWEPNAAPSACSDGSAAHGELCAPGGQDFLHRDSRGAQRDLRAIWDDPLETVISSNSQVDGPWVPLSGSSN